MAVVYDPIRAFSLATQAVDCSLEGLWGEVQTERDELVKETKGFFDEAARLLAEALEEELHRYVGDFHVACVAAALAIEKCEGWITEVDLTLEWVKGEIMERYRYSLTR